jgi:Meckel syndrome type 1 protein
MMLKRTYATLVLCLACVSALVACSAADNTNGTNMSNANANATSNSNANRAATTPAATPVAATTPAGSTSAAAGEKIGVAECDDYLAKLDACVTGKVPEAARAQFRTGMEQTRASWRTLAANPQTRGSLAAACKTAAESATATYKAYGCEF